MLCSLQGFAHASECDRLDHLILGNAVFAAFSPKPSLLDATKS